MAICFRAEGTAFHLVLLLLRLLLLGRVLRLWVMGLRVLLRWRRRRLCSGRLREIGLGLLRLVMLLSLLLGLGFDRMVGFSRGLLLRLCLLHRLRFLRSRSLGPLALLVVLLRFRLHVSILLRVRGR